MFEATLAQMIAVPAEMQESFEDACEESPNNKLPSSQAAPACCWLDGEICLREACFAFGERTPQAETPPRSLGSRNSPLQAFPEQSQAQHAGKRPPSVACSQDVHVNQHRFVLSNDLTV